MQTEQVLDPFKTVRLLRASREQFLNQVETKIHFEFFSNFVLESI